MILKKIETYEDLKHMNTLSFNWTESLHLHSCTYILVLGSVKIINVTCIRYWNWKSARWMHFWYDTCHTSLSFFSNRKKGTPMKKFRFYIYSEYRNANIRCKSDFYSTKTWDISFSNQDLNEISAFSYQRGPRPWHQGKPWVHYTRGASAQWTRAWFLN